MPTIRAGAKKTHVTVRNLGKSAKQELDQSALKKVRGGMGMVALTAKSPKPEGCDHAGQHCDMLHVSTMVKGTILTVVVDGRPKY